MDTRSIAEYKADFDTALKGIGRGKLTENINGSTFKDFRHYGRLQQIIIAVILGKTDYELEESGFYSVPRLRGYSFYLMKMFLNGDNNEK